MVQLGELMMILELHRQGLSITAIARRTGRDPKTVRKYIERGIEAPVYGPRSIGRPSKIAGYIDFLRAGGRLSRSQRRPADPQEPRTWLCRRLYGGEALP